jgi:hypothetical protein
MTKMSVGIVALALALAGAGCGGSDDNGLSKAEFTRKANAICAKGNKEIDAAANKTFTEKTEPPVSDQIAFIKDSVLPNVEQQISDIRALKPPEADKDKVEAILDAADEALAKTKKDPALGREEGPRDPFAQANKLARQYGMKTCGSG